MLKTSTIQIDPAWLPQLRAAGLTSVDEVYRCNAGTAVTQSGTTQVRRVSVGEGATARTVFIKKYWVTRPAQLWSGMFRGVLFGTSKARREFNNLNLLRARGLDAPVGVAFGEERRAGFVVRSFLISEGVADPQPLDLLIRDWLPTQPAAEQRRWRAELIQRLADYTRRLHAQRFVHHDYFWRNIILTGTSLEHFALIDAHKGRLWPAWAEQRSRAKDLATLDAPAAAFFRRTERLRFLLAYLGKKNLAASDKEFLRRVLSVAEPLRERQLRRVREAGQRV